MFTVAYHSKVQKDFRSMDKKDAETIRRIINTKLINKPEFFGKPLRQTLKNYRSLRIGNYRIVFEVQKKELIILIITVGNRDKVYQEAKKRQKEV